MKKALLILLFVIGLMAKQAFAQDKHLVDSLQTLLKTAKQDTARANILSQLTRVYLANDPEQALDYAKQLLSLSEQINYKKGISSAYNGMGLINSNKGDYFSALEFYKKALKIRIEMGDKKGIAGTYNNIGVIYRQQGNYPEALKNYFAALKINEETGNKTWQAFNYSNIGYIYVLQGNYPEALKNDLTALKIYEEIGYTAGIADAYMDIGVIYDYQGNYSEALKNQLVALKIKEQIGDKPSLASSYNNLGIVYHDQGNNPEALKNHFAALKIYEEIGDKDGIAKSYLNICEKYINQKKYNDASKYLIKTLSISKEIGSLEDIRGSYGFLAVLDSAQGNFKQALEHYKMYVVYRDSLINKENTKKIVQAQMQYEFDKKEAATKAEQDKKDALARKELQKQKLLNRGFAGGFAVLLIFAVVISIIRSQYQKIRLIEKERNRISRELHDDIGAELTRITVISQLLQKKTNKDDEMQEKLIKISEAGKKVLGSIGEIIWTMNPQKNNLESLVAYIRRFVTEYLEMNGIEVAIEVPEEIPVKSVSDQYRRNVFLVVKEAVYNITKYSKASRVRLSMNLGKRSAAIEISDNGTGFSVKEKQNWGNGLRNMNHRMKDIGGSFQITSEQNQGTLVRLNFPVR
jgi:signal transduction histidine kinase